MARQAEEHDLPGILSLYKHLFPDENYSNPEEYLKEWAEILNQDGICYFVAEEDGNVAAVCNIAVIPNLARNRRPYGVIENVITHPEMRRRGYGKDVVKKAIEYAKDRNCYKVMLLSGAARDTAHKFYEQIGFDGNSKKGFEIRFL
ncbi:MAG: GNAT family N-acetyltransferase [Spirochaetia bacterium]